VSDRAVASAVRAPWYTSVMRQLERGVLACLVISLCSCCAGGRGRPAPSTQPDANAQLSARESEPELAFGRGMTVEEAAAVSPEAAKAILVARAAIERGNRSSNDWHVELRFDVRRTPTGWLVGVSRFYHRGGAVAPVLGVPFVDIDKDWNAKVLPGA
jgi:hypothetical protein